MDASTISAATALVAVVVGPAASIYVAKRHIRASVLSANRQAWINRLRDELSKFVRDVKHIPSAQSSGVLTSSEAIGRCEETLLREEVIRLLLNPNEAEHKELLRLMANARTRMINAVNANRGLADQMEEVTQPVVELAQQVLKTEWERVKRGD